ncbi:uncharacterized protein LOC111023655 [Momordica charantia]|uniref:Uncharacterized protein LOC111023655 n=1 Tax=Momordica charantia TaxID=3673 RepID=A0A6J1DRE3_MOMCH|nr:uncharacterized protein LOC111023655 [Momordica charantia]XP_022156815.1 uncharacterized protein LOC111023655 [Momordica charantia]
MHGGNDILSQEIGSHILLPQSLVIYDNEKEIKHSRELFSLASGKSPTQPAPVSQTCLTREINYIGRAIQMIISKDVFGHEYKLFIMVEDVQKLFHMEPTTTPCIDAYMTFLHRSLGNENELSPYKFLDVGAISITNLSKENRVQVFEGM